MQFQCVAANCATFHPRGSLLCYAHRRLSLTGPSAPYYQSLLGHLLGVARHLLESRGICPDMLSIEEEIEMLEASLFSVTDAVEASNLAARMRAEQEKQGSESQEKAERAMLEHLLRKYAVFVEAPAKEEPKRFIDI